MALAPPLPSLPSFKHPPTSIDGASRPSCATDSVSSTPSSSQPLFVCFNQDYACFACGTETGFRIFSCDPFRETLRREFDGGGLFLNNGRRNPRLDSDGAGIGIVEMLFRSNILALVGGGRAPRYSPNKVMIWDDHQGRCIGELLFRSEVRAVRLRRDRIVVVLEHKIYVYNLGDLKIMHQVETLANPKGLCSLSPVTNSCVMACPGLHRGEVRIELYSNKKTRFIQAHTSSLACLLLCSNGSLLATASTKGTLIRIFSTTDGSKLRELRRGTDRADIYSLAFSSNCHWLAASSDKGTIHVFNLKFPWSSQDDVQAADGPHMSSSTYSNLSSSISNGFQMARSSLLSLASVNTGPSLSFMRGMLPKYFSSEWSFAQFRLPEDTHALVAFGPQKNTIVVVCSNGSFYRCAFDPVRGGEMVQQDYARFMKPDVEAL